MSAGLRPNVSRLSSKVAPLPFGERERPRPLLGLRLGGVPLRELILRDLAMLMVLGTGAMTPAGRPGERLRVRDRCRFLVDLPIQFFSVGGAGSCVGKSRIGFNSRCSSSSSPCEEESQLGTSSSTSDSGSGSSITRLSFVTAGRWSDESSETSDGSPRSRLSVSSPASSSCASPSLSDSIFGPIDRFVGCVVVASSTFISTCSSSETEL